MIGFSGTYHISIDEKGRINVPAKIKTTLEQKYDADLVMYVKDKYIAIFPEKEWLVNVEKYNHLNAFEDEGRETLRKLYAQAEECKIRSGKILIPAALRERVYLSREAVLVGVNTSFEIWPKDSWEE